MTCTTRLDQERLRRVLDSQFGVVSCDQVRACGMTRKTLAYRVRQDGPWQRVLPGVYVTVTGTVTQEQREMAALLYAGPRSVITGPAAVRRHRLVSPGPDAVDVLIPWDVKRQSLQFVRVHRTRRMPANTYTTRELRFAAPARAVSDAARMLTRFDDVRAVVSEALLRKACTLSDLVRELADGGSAGSFLFREALAEVGDGIRSVAGADFRQLILRSGLPRPMFNARLYVAGKFMAMVDAWWQRAGVAAEVDSRAYHIRAKDQDDTNARHALLLAHGILPLHFAPKRLRTEEQAVIAAISSTIEQGLLRPPLPITAVPIAA